MAGFLQLAFSFPTVVFTTLLLVMLIYWGLVLVGALGFDALEGASGGLEAKAGVLDAKAGLLDAKAGLLEAKGGALEGMDGGGLLASLGFGVVPSTVALSILIFWCWAMSMAGSAWLGPTLGGFLPAWGAGLSVLALASFAALLLSMVSVKPLRPLFLLKRAPQRRQLLGRVATVASLRVDERFGQATLEDGGAGLILPIFCGKKNELKKGDQVLLLEYDDAMEAYEIEPVDWLLPEEVRQLDDVAAAERIARAHLKQR